MARQSSDEQLKSYLAPVRRLLASSTPDNATAAGKRLSA
jgi:hypothetical protein